MTVQTLIISEHTEYITSLASDFDQTLKRMLDKGIERQRDQEIKDDLYSECVEHAIFAQNKSKEFHGREQLLSDMKDKFVNTAG